MQEEAINSIEWAVLAAALVLAARLVSIIQASRGVDPAYRELHTGLLEGGIDRAEREARGLGYRNPFGEIASELLNASQREARDAQHRSEFVQRALGTQRRKWTRRTAQGRALDLFALVVGAVVIAFAPQTLRTGPLFWSCGGAIPVLLLGTIVARGQLLANLLRAATQLADALVSRPALPSLSGTPLPCFWCGHKTRETHIRLVDGGDQEPATRALVCDDCGKLVASLGESNED